MGWKCGIGTIKSNGNQGHHYKRPFGSSSVHNLSKNDSMLSSVKS